MNAWRIALALAAAFFALWALANVVVHRTPIWIPIGIDAAILGVAALFERGRYRPRVDAARGEWRATGERFYDPVTGHPTDVYYDARTGARDYRTP